MPGVLVRDGPGLQGHRLVQERVLSGLFATTGRHWLFRQMLPPDEADEPGGDSDQVGV